MAEIISLTGVLIAIIFAGCAGVGGFFAGLYLKKTPEKPQTATSWLEEQEVMRKVLQIHKEISLLEEKTKILCSYAQQKIEANKRKSRL